VENQGDLPELYDLLLDPFQLNNKATDSGYSTILSDMQQRLRRLRSQ
jgi:hypothetical protein